MIPRTSETILWLGLLGFGSWSGSEKFEKAGSASSTLSEQASGPRLCLAGETAGKHVAIWFDFEYAQLEPWFGTATEVGGSWLFVRSEWGWLGAGPELSLHYESSLHNAKPMGDFYRYGDFTFLAGIAAEGSYWPADDLRFGLRLGAAPIPLVGYRKYGGGILPPSANAAPQLSYDLSGLFEASGELQAEYEVGEAVQCGLSVRGDLVTYQQTAPYQTGLWTSHVFQSSVAVRLLVGKRF